MDTTKDHSREAPRDIRESKDMPGDRAGTGVHKTGAQVQGYNAKDHDDVLRRINRKPLTVDNKQTVTREGNVITVQMPNGAIYRATLGEREVPLEVPTVPPQPSKELPKGGVIPETITAADVKTWEYTAPPRLPVEGKPQPVPEKAMPIPDRR